MEWVRSKGLHALGLLGLSALGCSDRDVSVQLRSLSKSGEIAFVCRGFDAEGTSRGAPVTQCQHATLDGQVRDLIALVTQTATGEVALVNVPADPRDPRPGEGVIDIDPATPSFGFLRVGANPTDILSTPEGEASFVSSADPARPGLYALPTSCLRPPNVEQSIRDLTTWAACRLPSPPGDMELVFEARSETACPSTQEESPESSPSDGPDRECPANLLLRAPEGRYKLLVALPESGSIAVVDAQSLLDREPGTFEACPIEQSYALSVDLPPDPRAPALPEGLNACVSPPPTPPPPGAFTPRPADLALASDVLYVADEGAPVVHRLDVARPCAATEMPSLLPTSVESPARTVITSRVSVSPLTPSGKRFLYAVDREDLPMSSVMVFDVSPDSTARTPVIRQGFADIPGDTPDRLRFAAPVRDVLFIERDDPLTQNDTGNGLAGQACNPNPVPNEPGTEYQSTIGVSVSGTQDLRGVFALVLLSNGVLSVVDVDDYDAPCRRPTSINTGSDPDIHGCANDRPDPGVTEFVRPDGTPSVTNELSCRIVTPHRERSAFYNLNGTEGGVHGPSLRSFPQLDVPENALGTTFGERPKLLGVDFESAAGKVSPAELYVGISLYSHASDAVNPLVIDPATAPRYSVTLPFAEPRAYTTDTQLLTYEGAIAGGLTNAILKFDPETDALSVIDPANGGFCGLGVNDIELMKELGAERFGLSGAALDTFAASHADALWITGGVPEEDDVYWRTNPSCTRTECLNTFGEVDADEPNLARRFGILDANDARMTLSSSRPALAACCFPPGTAYQIRATRQWVLAGRTTGIRHAIVASPRTLASGEKVFECVRDCDFSKRWDDPRVFEIACGSADEPCDPSIGVASSRPGEDPCQLDPSRDSRDGFAVSLDEPAAACIHATPTARFAVYRGSSGSTRGMSFSWDVSQAFQPLGLDLRSLSTSVSPTRVAALPSLDWLTILDSANLGLVVVDLNGFQVLTPTIN